MPWIIAGIIIIISVSFLLFERLTKIYLYRTKRTAPPAEEFPNTSESDIKNSIALTLN